ncbi:HesA/MoeB/ThiF family protein [Pseudodesulfovibrio piezophilus]|uniref:UBA/THIF-type NAD/FAD binding protein n=1 Tax=Pseudodesulfovibrio piezophilus (strain DSM 21447 / JCM 15486 / C1TLV30) TaxID=1322246 RepID=M1WN67_PSEP2|nr:ThiF family adenylyltransferase [Pseudodesulfovibrio piezophilus]CCH47374.1 UBA/THIF-type NAD/FAD binding protein [Pseudodesulfovibrio piezophilus C1TLV30]
MISLADMITEQAEPYSSSKGESQQVISSEAIAAIAKHHAQPGSSIEAQALRQKITPLRYLRNQNAIPAQEQILLLESSIAQVGLGGLGGTLLDIFLRTGIGSIKAADGDLFEESNLNRQSLSTQKTLGWEKSRAANQRAYTINPSVSFDARHLFLKPKELPEFLTGADIAIDALGGLETRLALQQAAARVDIPLVTGALAGWTGYVGVILPGQPGPAEIMGRNNAAEEMLGCPAPTVTLIASLMAALTVQLLSGHPSLLAASIFVIDLKSLTFEKISL